MNGRPVADPYFHGYTRDLHSTIPPGQTWAASLALVLDQSCISSLQGGRAGMFGAACQAARGCLGQQSVLIELILGQCSSCLVNKASWKCKERVGWPGRTALHLACLQGSTEVANFLLEHGARSSIADGKAST
eukprot:100696-Amphidinium_carterae.2